MGISHLLQFLCIRCLCSSFLKQSAQLEVRHNTTNLCLHFLQTVPTAVMKTTCLRSLYSKKQHPLRRHLPPSSRENARLRTILPTLHGVTRRLRWRCTMKNERASSSSEGSPRLLHLFRRNTRIADFSGIGTGELRLVRGIKAVC